MARIDIDPDDLEEYIDSVIDEKIKYLRQYEGIVRNNIDPENTGRVLLEIHDLGWSTPDLWVWAEPEFPNVGSWMIPGIGDEVKVYFDKGDVEAPIYRGCFYYDLSNPSPETLATKGIVFKTKTNQIQVKYDDATGNLEILAGLAGKILIKTDAGGIGQVEMDAQGVRLGQALGGVIACVATNTVNTLIGPQPINPGQNTTNKA